MAVGDHVIDQRPPPPILSTALSYERWGVGDVMRLPPGMLRQMNIAINYYRTLNAYRSAQKTGEWARRNPQAWDMVSWYLGQRMEQRRGDRNQ